MFNEFNKKTSKETPYIWPPFISHLKVSSLLSYSTYTRHSVWVTKDGRAFCVGFNEDNRIIDTVDKKTIQNEKEVIIKNKDGHQLKFISAVCGVFYTLYLVQGENGGNNQLVFSYSNNSKPLFLKTDNYNPKYLFGGRNTAIAVDGDGAIFVINHSVLNNPNDEIEAFFLPNDEKPTSIAICQDSVIIVGSKGGIYESSLNTKGISRLILLPIKELEKKTN